MSKEDILKRLPKPKREKILLEEARIARMRAEDRLFETEKQLSASLRIRAK